MNAFMVSRNSFSLKIGLCCIDLLFGNHYLLTALSSPVDLHSCEFVTSKRDIVMALLQNFAV